MSLIFGDITASLITGDIIYFVLRGVFFSRYVQLKTFFSSEKNISGEI